jgi:hypothetical protein
LRAAREWRAASDRLGEFYALAVVFGTAYGGVMPLYAVLTREYFGQQLMGTVFGAANRHDLWAACRGLGSIFSMATSSPARLPSNWARPP